MTPAERGEVTGLLKAWSGGDPAALDRLTPLVYGELYRIGHRYMQGERAGNTLQTTALINEVYLRLVDVANVDWQQRAQFFAICAQMMRRILVDAARARGRQKRGAGAGRVNVEDVALVSPEPQHSVIALDAALEEFAKDRTAPGKGDRTALLWWPGRKRNRRGTADIDAHRRARLDFRKIVVDARAPPLKDSTPRTLTVETLYEKPAFSLGNTLSGGSQLAGSYASNRRGRNDMGHCR